MKKDDRVTVCLPNCPQAVLCFYGLNLIGAVATMIHPALERGGDRLLPARFRLPRGRDARPVLRQVPGGHARAAARPARRRHGGGRAFRPCCARGYWLTQGRKLKTPPLTPPAETWRDFLRAGDAYEQPYLVRRAAEDPAVILFSGGTTGVTKGILLSNLNFNALGTQTIAMATTFETGAEHAGQPCPIFHGFGLGVCIHTILIAGGTSILVPRVSVESYARLLKKEQPTYIAGVPTLFEGITRNPYMREVNLACLRGVFSGGDSLSIELKKKFDLFLREHGATVQVREGYGTTECVTASCLTPYDMYREGSIGLPFPGHVLQDRQDRHDRRAALRPGGRDLPDRAVHDARLRQPAGGDGQRHARATRPTGSPGCTRATWATWTRTALSTSASASSA